MSDEGTLRDLRPQSETENRATARPKWQRARILDQRPHRTYPYPHQQPGMLVWVRIGRPRVERVRLPSWRIAEVECFVIAPTAPLIEGRPWGVPADGVELLSEFSFDDDPDAEVRQ